MALEAWWGDMKKCPARWGAIDDDEHLVGELGNGPRGLGSPRAKHREQAEEMANPMRASGWPDVARR